MPADRKPPATVDDYLAAQPPKVRSVLKRIRAAVHRAVPDVTEKISYQMPSFWLDRVLIYVGAFKSHIGVFPPVRDADLSREVARYAGPKGNLQFPLDEPIPYDLIARIARAQADVKPRPAKKTKSPAARKPVARRR